MRSPGAGVMEIRRRRRLGGCRWSGAGGDTRQAVSPGCVRSTGGLPASSQEQARADAPRGFEREVQTCPSPRRARRMAVLLAPGEQQPEGIGDVPGRFGVHGDDADLDPALIGNVVRRVRGRKRVREAHGFGAHEAEPDLGRGTARTVSRGPWRAARRGRDQSCHRCTTYPQLFPRYSCLASQPFQLSAAYRGGTEGIAYSGRHAGSSSARDEPRTCPSGRRGDGSASCPPPSKQLRASSASVPSCAPAGWRRDGPAAAGHSSA